MSARAVLSAASTPLVRRVAVGVALALVVAGLALGMRGPEEPIRVSADFADTTGVYVGNEVDHLGVPVGEIVRVEPRGTTMRVHMELEPGTEVPAEAGAEILQSSLVTDRYVELGPAYDGGETLADGAHIGADRTRSPATIDEVTASVDELVRALDTRTPGGKDIGDLLHVGARNLDGNGGRLHDALVGGERALRSLNTHAGDVTAVTRNLAVLTDALAAKDTLVRRFSRQLALTSGEVAAQRKSLSSTLSALVDLSEVVTRFVRRNHELVDTDLRRARQLVEVVHRRRESLGEAWDVMPTFAQNMTQAYDTEHQALRVQFSTRMGPFQRRARADLCDRLSLPLCGLLFQPDGSGLLDPLFDDISDRIPRNWP